MRILLARLHSVFLAMLLGLPAQAGGVLLTKDDLVRVQPSVWAATGLALPEPDPALPIVGPRNTQDGARLLRYLNGQGGINGFAGILYDNRDRGHSTLPRDQYPRLTHLEYGPQLAAKGLDYGLAGRIVLPAVVLGNSSTAMTRGPAARSQPRLAMTSASWRAIMPMLYANNHIYVYPEHRDHDAEDLFPVNWPYTIISQGSSGSDRVFLNAVAMTLAAFPADTFAALREQRLVAPTVQMILRRNLATVSSRADYLSGKAHPPVFDGRQVRSGRMVAQASDLRPEDIPPLVRLRVIEDGFAEAAGLAGLDERLLDTPAAIGRLWRGFAWERALTVTAENTSAPNDRPLSFEWRLLRGDPARVRIEPQGPDGRTARIHVAWHEPWSEPIPGSRDNGVRRVSRVDIGVFAHNGVHDSAPALISIDFPEHQIRQYAPGDGDRRRLVSIDYDAVGRGAYFDPLLYWSAPWTDTARYDENGTLLGWDRRSADGVMDFVPVGADDTRLPHYEVDPSAPDVPILRHVGERRPPR
ncbi:MAG: hypothetical protein ACP5EN_13680 [Rhodovulum sp.]